MMDRIKKQPWLLIVQWFGIGCLSASAIVDSVTDHGVLMAINCFCLGIIVMSMLSVRLVARMASCLAHQDAVLGCLAAELERAIRTGRITVEMTAPDRAPHATSDHTTFH